MIILMQFMKFCVQTEIQTHIHTADTITLIDFIHVNKIEADA